MRKECELRHGANSSTNHLGEETMMNQKLLKRFVSSASKVFLLSNFLIFLFFIAVSVAGDNKLKDHTYVKVLDAPNHGIFYACDSYPVELRDLAGPVDGHVHHPILSAVAFCTDEILSEQQTTIHFGSSDSDNVVDENGLVPIYSVASAYCTESGGAYEPAVKVVLVCWDTEVDSGFPATYKIYGD